MNLRNYFTKSFAIVLSLSIILRQIWIFSIIERDEGGLALVGLQWLNGYLPYVHSLNNAGPLADAIYAICTYFLGRNFVMIRIMNNIVFFISIIALYLFAKDWFSQRIALISSLFYGVFMSAPIYEGQLALTSSLSAPIIVFSIFFCGIYIKRNSKKYLFIASIIMSMAALIKVIDVFGLILLAGAISVNYFHNKSKGFQMGKILDNLTTAAIGFVVLPTFFLIYFTSAGALGDIINVFINKTLIGYQTLPDVPFGIIFNVVAQGLPLWIFALIGLIFSIRKNKFSSFLIVWLALGIAITAFPPHFGHRFVYLIAPASVLAGLGVSKMLDNFKNGLKKNLGGKHVFRWLTLSLLMLSLPVAFVFQAEQFPQYNITSKFLNYSWLYADCSSYSAQIKVGEFLKENTSNNSKILVHGWSSELYYLANKMPPSEYVWTLRSGVEVQVPESEYNRLVESVKNREFEFIVFFDSSLAALNNRINDPIVNETLNSNQYVYNCSMENAQIFSR